MQDLPDTVSTLEALARFLDEDLVPALAGKARLAYRCKVAASLARTVAREVRLAGASDEAEYARLQAALGRTDPAPANEEAMRVELSRLESELVEQLRHGSLSTEKLRFIRGHLIETLRDHLAAIQPGFDLRPDPESPP